MVVDMSCAGESQRRFEILESSQRLPPATRINIKLGKSDLSSGSLSSSHVPRSVLIDDVRTPW